MKLKTTIYNSPKIYLWNNRIVMSEFPFSLRVEFFMTIMWMHSTVSIVEKEERLFLFQNVHACTKKARAKTRTRKKKASKTKLLWPTFPILPSGSILMHFYGSIFLFLFSILFFSGYNVLCGALPRSSFSFSLSSSVSLTEKPRNVYVCWSNKFLYDLINVLDI